MLYHNYNDNDYNNIHSDNDNNYDYNDDNDNYNDIENDKGKSNSTAIGWSSRVILTNLTIEGCLDWFVANPWQVC